MSEVDELKMVIAVQRKKMKEADDRITLAIEQVDRIRKEKRDKSSHPK